MDFFSRQERSRRTTRFLVGVFMLAFLACAAATTAAVIAAARLSLDKNIAGPFSSGWAEWSAQHVPLLGLVLAGTLGVMVLASVFRAASLAGGGAQVARMLGGTEITTESTDPTHRRLINVVEEIALASGIPVPDVYVLDKEPGINAFAAGLTHSNAAIAVTRGALERLSRAELQGVIAHEFSHILNGDMRINQQLIGFSFGILVLSLAGRWLLRSMRFGAGRRNKGFAVVIVLGVTLTIVGAIGLLLSRLIKAAVSRQREALADASAVQFTREPEGLAGALKKIGGYTARLSSVDSEEVAHMLFEHKSLAINRWFATHPPLLERIRALDPTFEPGDFPRAEHAMPSAAASGEAETVSSLANAEPAGDELLQRAGRIESAQVGGALRAAFPEELEHSAHSRESSLLLVLALTLASSEEIRRHQLSLIEGQLGAERVHRCSVLYRLIEPLDPKLRLPLLELSMPALKQRPREQLEYLFDLAGRLTLLDGERSLFDYVLLRLLAAYLPNLPATAPQAKGAKLSVREALAALLANVAAFGHEDAAAARAAYRAGLSVAAAPGAAVPEPQFEPLSAARDFAKLDAALLPLSKLRPRAKRRVLAGVLATIRHDRRIETGEIELFRAIAATLGCPLPPAFSIRGDPG